MIEIIIEPEIERLRLKSLSFYLASFFWGTGRKYNARRTKLNNMLIIYVLCNLKDRIDLFRKYFYTYDGPDGLFGFFSVEMGIMALELYPGKVDDFICDKREITEGIYEFLMKPEDKELFCNYRDYVKKHNVLTDYDKELLEKIFRKFGAYSSTDMFIDMYEFRKVIPFKGIVGGHRDLDVDEFIECLENNKDKYSENEIFNFIKSHYDAVKYDNIGKNLKQRETENLLLLKEKVERESEIVYTLRKMTESTGTERVIGLVKMVQEIEKMANLENMILDQVIDLYKDKEIEKSGSKKKVKRKKFW